MIIFTSILRGFVEQVEEMRQARDDERVIDQDTRVKHKLQPLPDSDAPLLTG